MRRGKLIATALTLALVVTSICVPDGSASAAKKATLNKKTAKVEVGKTIKLNVKNGKKSAKVTWTTSNKKIAKITKKTAKGNAASATIKGVSKGKVSITATYKLGKKTKLVCKVTVREASKVNPTATTVAAVKATATTAPTAAATTAVVATTAPILTPTATAANTASAKPTTKPTTKPTKAPTAKPTKAPTATPEPMLVNPSTLDLAELSAAKAIVGENGGSAAYNAETKTIDSAMKGTTGFIVKMPTTEKSAKYSYVKVTYTLAGGDVNIYLGDKAIEGDGSGQGAAGWSGEIKLNQYEMGEGTEVTALFSIRDAFTDSQDDYIKALKFFNFGDETTMSIKSISLYMDGTKEKQEDFVATKKSAAITVDGLAGADEEWAKAQEYSFVSKVALEGGIVPTDSSATAKFLYDEDNMYFFVDVKDSSIDASSGNNYDRDGLEILFDEDNCKKDGADSADWTDNKDGLHYRATGLDPKSAEKFNLVSSESAIQGGGVDGKKKTGIEVKYALTAKGYSMEGKIPFTAKKAGGEIIGMDIIVQDCKEGVRANEIYLTYTIDPKVYWNNTSAAFGNVLLEKAQATDPEVKPGTDDKKDTETTTDPVTDPDKTTTTDTTTDPKTEA